MCRAMLNNVANMDNFALYLLLSRYVALNVALTYAIKKIARELKYYSRKRKINDTL